MINDFLPLSEYIKKAEQCAYKRVKYPSEDLISYVLNYIVRADMRFKYDKTNKYTADTSRHKWLHYCGCFAVRSFYQRKQSDILSLDTQIKTEGKHSMINFVASKEELPEFHVDFNNMVEDMEKLLTKREFYCIMSCVMGSRKQSCLSRELKISRQRVQQCVQSGLTKIRKHLEKYNDTI